MATEPPQAFPILQTAAANPDAPAVFLGSPQHEKTPNNPPLSFSLPEATVLRRPRPPPRTTSLAYKRSPSLPEKIHTIPSYLPDILLSLLALSIELAGASGAPRAPHVPGVLEALPTRRLLKPAERSRRRRRDASPPPVASPVSLPNHRLLPGSLSQCLVGLGKKTPTRYRFGHKFWQSGPLCQPIFVFLFFSLPPRTEDWTGQACAIWAGQAPYSWPVSNSVYVVFF
jgi:hypothetical protein